MKPLIVFLSLTIYGTTLIAQLPKKVVVEHSTNTVCGTCAIRNPALFQNLDQHPEILHISYHPSVPYPSCLLYQHNPEENNGRTEAISLYGSTPKISIQGKVIPGSGSFDDPELFDPYLGQSSPFELQITETRQENSTILARVVVHTIANQSLTEARLYIAYVEDTVFYTSPNGETEHYNVFRKAFTEDAGQSITPAATGDSVVVELSISQNSAWDMQRMYVMALLQNPDNRDMLQAATTDILLGGTPSSLSEYGPETIGVYPNPAQNMIYFETEDEVQIFNVSGQLVKSVAAGLKSADISHLPEGMYLLRSGKQSRKIMINR